MNFTPFILVLSSLLLVGCGNQSQPSQVLDDFFDSRKIEIPSDQLNTAFGYRTFYSVSHSSRYLASAGSDKWIYTWQFDKESSLMFRRALKGHQDAVLATAISPNNAYLVSGAYDRKLLLWDLESGNVVKTVEAEDPPSAIAFQPGHPQTFATFLRDDEVTLFDGPRRLQVIKPGTTDIRSLDWSSDGSYLAISGKRGIAIWSSAKQRVIHRLALEGNSIARNLVLAGERRMFAMTGRKILLWEDFLESEPRSINLAQRCISAASIDDKRVAIGCTDGNVRVVSFASDWVISVVSAFQASVEGLAYLPQSDRVVAGGYEDYLVTWRYD